MQVDPGRVVCARIRFSVLSTLCLYQISSFHYNSYSCTISLSFSHVEINSFMRCTFLYGLFIYTLHILMRPISLYFTSYLVYVLAICLLHSFMRCTHPCIHVLYSLVRHITLIYLLHVSATLPIPSGQLSLVSHPRSYTSFVVSFPHHISRWMFSS